MAKWRVAHDSLVISGVLYGAESIVTDEMIKEGNVNLRTLAAYKLNGTLVPYEEQKYQFGEEEAGATITLQIDDEIGTEETGA